MAEQTKSIFVYGDWENLNGPKLIGTLFSGCLKNKEIFSFEYNPTWLKENPISFFDPDLQFYSGRQFLEQDKTIFGVFTDSCPDRWGRVLMTRREAILAKEEGREKKKLTESDYLLGIQDELRTGALRFKTSEDGDFLAADKEHIIPVWTSIRELEDAAFRFDAGDGTDEEIKKWLNLLLQPGSSLGGARPKATVRAPDGSLWIAKFPSKHDSIDTGAWEMVIHELAVLCGLNVPQAKCERFSKNGHTFLVKRFDRVGKRSSDAAPERIHFVSAMTVLGKKDGDGADSGVSYLDIAQAIRQNSVTPKKDLQEMWKRIVFSIAVTNTDDHLRNHGFLFDSNGFHLSPLYDVNPNPEGTGLSLNIDETDNSLDYDLAIQTAPYFEMKKDEAANYVSQTKKNISSWKQIVQRFDIPRSAVLEMENCFKL